MRLNPTDWGSLDTMLFLFPREDLIAYSAAPWIGVRNYLLVLHCLETRFFICRLEYSQDTSDTFTEC